VKYTAFDDHIGCRSAFERGESEEVERYGEDGLGHAERRRDVGEMLVPMLSRGKQANQWSSELFLLQRQVNCRLCCANGQMLST